jgi:UDP-GlcNAc:undecaprenyl-phosphate GlcNAc-1-phosphate transferase
MYRRLREGKSPFKPDRGHIHHIIMGIGLGQRRTLICLVTLSAALAFFGSVVRMFGTTTSLAAFGTLLGAYILTATRIWERQQKKQRIMASTHAANDANISIPVARVSALQSVADSNPSPLSD